MPVDRFADDVTIRLRALGAQLDVIAPPVSVDELPAVSGTMLEPSQPARRGTRWLAVAAAALMAAGAAGLWWTAGQGDERPVEGTLNPVENTRTEVSEPAPTTQAPNPTTTATPLPVEETPVTSPPEMVPVEGTADLAPLSDLARSGLPIPTELPAGSEFQPLIRITPDGSADNYFIRGNEDSSLFVTVAPGSPPPPEDPNPNPPGDLHSLTMNGIDWTIASMSDRGHYAWAFVGDTEINLSSQGHSRETLELIIAGLRTAAIDDYPSIVFDAYTDGIEVAGTPDNSATLYLLRRDQWRCFSLRNETTSLVGGCNDEPIPPSGVLVLGSGGESTFDDSDPSAPPETWTVYLAGVGPATATEVELEFLDGQIVRVPLQNRTGQSDERYFATIVTVDGDPFRSDSPVVGASAIYDD